MKPLLATASQLVRLWDRHRNNDKPIDPGTVQHGLKFRSRFRCVGVRR